MEEVPGHSTGPESGPRVDFILQGCTQIRDEYLTKENTVVVWMVGKTVSLGFLGSV